MITGNNNSIERKRREALLAHMGVLLQGMSLPSFAMATGALLGMVSADIELQKLVNSDSVVKDAMDKMKEGGATGGKGVGGD